MAKLTFNIPDAQVSDFVDVMARHFGYQEEIEGQPNPTTRVAYVKQNIARAMRSTYARAKERQTAEDAVITPPDITPE